MMKASLLLLVFFVLQACALVPASRYTGAKQRQSELNRPRRPAKAFFATTPSSSVANADTNTNNKILNMSVQLIGKSTSIVVSAIFGALLLYHRDALMVSLFVGAIVNGKLATISMPLHIQQKIHISHTMSFCSTTF
jgi:hypothetical protein